MNVLYKLTAKGGFNDIRDLETYFKNDIKEQSNYFNCNNKLNNFKENDEIYFIFNKMILAKASFTGKSKINNDNNFRYGFELKEIKYKTTNQEINFSIVGEFQTMKYVRENTIQSEINKLVESL